MNHKEEYKAFCEQHTVSLFTSYWWWHHIVQENWNVLLYKKGREVLACFPYHIKSKYGLKAIIPPTLTPYQGIAYAVPKDAKNDKVISFKRKVQEYFIAHLPKTALIIGQLDWQETYALPFHWNKFDLRTRYTYILETNSSEDVLYQNLKDSLRREISKAKSAYQMEDNEDTAALFNIKKINADLFKEPLSYSAKTLENIAKLIDLNQAKLLEIKDNQTTIASLLICWDKSQMYYSCGGLHPDYRNSGALSWLLWEAILLAKNLNIPFNFEGSMMKPIERYFANFGGNPMPFIEYKRINSRMLKPFLGKV